MAKGTESLQRARRCASCRRQADPHGVWESAEVGWPHGAVSGPHPRVPSELLDWLGRPQSEQGPGRGQESGLGSFSHKPRAEAVGAVNPGDSGAWTQCGPRPLPQGLCEEILSSRPFSGCNALVDASSYVEACHQDLCLCEQDNLTSCICHTLAEYSRQCAHAGGLPQDWRGPDLCRECPAWPSPSRGPASGPRAGAGHDAACPPCSADVPPQHAVPRVRLAVLRHLLQPRALTAL